MLSLCCRLLSCLFRLLLHIRCVEVQLELVVWWPPGLLRQYLLLVPFIVHVLVDESHDRVSVEV